MLTELLRSSFSAVPVTDYQRETSPDLAHVIAPRMGGVLGASQAVHPQELISLYDKVAVVYRCVTIRAERLAQGKLRLMRKLRSGRLVELRPNRPSAELLRHVNDSMTQTELLDHGEFGRGLFGSDYWQVEVGPGNRAVALHPMNAGRVKILVDTGGVRGYRYQVGHLKQDFSPDEVFHLKGRWDPGNDFYPASPLRHALNTGRLDLKQQEISLAMTQNGVAPSGVLWVEQGTTPDQVKTVEHQLTENFAGARNVGKTLVVPGGRGYQPTSISLVDLQILESRSFNEDQIRIVYGVFAVPYGKMDTSATRENATIQRVLQHEGTTIPAGESMAEQVTERLIPLLGYDDGDVVAVLDYSHTRIERELRNESALALEKLVDRGILTQNEVRAERGDEPVPWGDSWWGKAGMIELASLEDGSRGAVTRLGRQYGAMTKALKRIGVNVLTASQEQVEEGLRVMDGEMSAVRMAVSSAREETPGEPTIVDIVAEHPRVMLCGYPDVGKTTVSRQVADRPRFNTGTRGSAEDVDDDVEMTPDDVEMGELARHWVERLAGEERYLLEGVFAPRVARRMLSDDQVAVDAVVWIDPHEDWEPDERREAFRKAIDTVWDDFVELNEELGDIVKIYESTAPKLAAEG